MRSRRESGQAAVETAIVMPLFVFIMLGLVQLMLLYNGRMMVKYAAFKATRAGVVNRVKDTAMEKAALAVLMPFVTRTNGETLYKLDGAASYLVAYNLSRPNRYLSSGVPIVEVMVCQPTSGQTNDTTDFDSPLSATDGSGNWDPAAWNRTRLATQVTFYMPMVIPFANGVLWYIMLGANQWTGGNRDMMYTLRLKNRKFGANEKKAADTFKNKTMFAGRFLKKYYVPIRGAWSMRMMSNALPGSLPAANNCKVPYKKGVQENSL